MSWFEWDTLDSSSYFDKGIAQSNVAQSHIIIRARHNQKYYITTTSFGHTQDIGPFDTLEAAKVYFRIMM
jgi:hypothetical protein